jgi:hypothetical protein
MRAQAMLLALKGASNLAFATDPLEERGGLLREGRNSQEAPSLGFRWSEASVKFSDETNNSATGQQRCILRRSSLNRNANESGKGSDTGSPN